MGNRIVIFGIGDFAAMAAIYFERDYHYEIAGFVVESKYKNKEEFMGKKVIDFESIRYTFPPDENMAFIAVTYQCLNRERHRLFRETKDMGYEMANYVSPFSYVEKNVEIGENVFVFENNTLQYGVRIGNNTIIWSGNHIGHSTIVGNDTYISSHVCISGKCSIGDKCFLGVNSAIADSVVVPDDTLLAMGAAMTKTIEKRGCILAGVPAREMKKTSYEYFGVRRDEI